VYHPLSITAHELYSSRLGAAKHKPKLFASSSIAAGH